MFLKPKFMSKEEFFNGRNRRIRGEHKYEIENALKEFNHRDDGVMYIDAKEAGYASVESARGGFYAAIKRLALNMSVSCDRKGGILYVIKNVD